MFESKTILLVGILRNVEYALKCPDWRIVVMSVAQWGDCLHYKPLSLDNSLALTAYIRPGDVTYL